MRRKLENPAVTLGDKCVAIVMSLVLEDSEDPHEVLMWHTLLKIAAHDVIKHGIKTGGLAPELAAQFIEKFGGK